MTVFNATMATTFEAKAATKTKPGTATALVSAYQTPYKIGDPVETHVIQPGAFAAYQGDTIPVYFSHSHSWEEPGIPIGHGVVGDSDEGLLVEASFYTDIDPDIQKLHRNVVAGGIREWSVAYSVEDFEKGETKDHKNVTKAQLVEASLTLRGANPGTRTLSAASKKKDDVDPAAALLAGLDVDALAAALAPLMIDKLLTAASVAKALPVPKLSEQFDVSEFAEAVLAAQEQALEDAEQARLEAESAAEAAAAEAAALAAAENGGQLLALATRRRY